MKFTENIRKRTIFDLPRFAESACYFDDSVPSIARPNHAGVISALAAFSGVLSTVATWQISYPWVFYLAPGIFFGVLVLLPWCLRCRISWWQTLLTVCLAPIGYACAVHLVQTGTAYMLFAGLAGCVITFAPLFVGTHPRIRSCVFNALRIGWLVGIPLCVGCLAMIGGVAAWQLAVACCLNAAFHGDEH